ncbi:hypothetical protein J6590_015625 [Homalodisca vitripennis]|nr:hypothetical protein J6590_015625 [Homalodisca vitripennis]
MCYIFPEIRCYCNLPECITTSYMCKSEGLGCFSDILAFSDVNKASHGCLDLLQSGRQDQCQNEPSSRSVAQPRSLLLCCYRDLCNHVDSPETRQRYNDSVLVVREKGLILYNLQNMSVTDITSQSEECKLKEESILHAMKKHL